jgi:SAM-dependent methyltransferase
MLSDGREPGSATMPTTAGDTSAADHRDYWEDFYRRKSAAVPPEPSQFARWVAEREQPGSVVVDMGCGTGRDSLWLARRGYRCIGLDYAAPAVQVAQDAADANGLGARFYQANLADSDNVERIVDQVMGHGKPDVVYARFFVHAIDDDVRQNLWSFAGSLLPAGGRLYAEFRTEPTVHEFGEHYRHFVPSDVVVGELQALGWEVLERLNGRGMAVYKHEDPVVCRLVARR